LPPASWMRRAASSRVMPPSVPVSTKVFPGKRSRRGAARARLGANARFGEPPYEIAAGLGEEEPGDARGRFPGRSSPPREGLPRPHGRRLERAEMIRSVFAIVAPTCGIPIAWRRRSSGAVLLRSIPASRFDTDFSPRRRSPPDSTCAREVIEIGGVLHQPGIHEPSRRSSSQAFDIQGAAAREVDDPAPHLGGTERVLAPRGRLFGIAHERGPAYRGSFGASRTWARAVPSRARRAAPWESPPPPFSITTRSPTRKSFRLDLVLIVERRARHQPCRGASPVRGSRPA